MEKINSEVRPEYVTQSMWRVVHYNGLAINEYPSEFATWLQNVLCDFEHEFLVHIENITTTKNSAIVVLGLARK